MATLKEYLQNLYNIKLQPSKFVKLCEAYKNTQRVIKDLQDENEKVKNNIIALMNGREEKTEGATTATNKTIIVNKFIISEFKPANQELYSKYLKPIEYKQFKVN